MLSSSVKLCFNSNCKSPSEHWKRGWRRRTGDYANLCDPCGSAYEEGKFCETFHLNASGWRCCESCGKQIHCGCIVSFHLFVLLDAGGIECLTCAKRSYILTPNPAWPTPPHFLTSHPERMKNLSMKTSSALPGWCPLPWHQAPSLLNGSDIHHDVKSRMPFEINKSGCPDRFKWIENLSTSPPAMKQEGIYGRVVKGKLNLVRSELRQSGNAGILIKEQHNSYFNGSKPMFGTIDDSSSNMSLDSAFSEIETDITQLSAILSQRAVAANPSCRCVCNHNTIDSSGEGPVHNVKARGDGCDLKQSLPFYHLQITNKELQQISSDSKTVTAPLFEKILSASDAGRVGRLVLPKKCAEAHFPPITHPEGMPLKVLDVKGKEWVFQFRFWTNNNSRMYVLEGVTPCIQSMQLRAGDVVTFSRLDPEGKLVIGGRKTPASRSLTQVDDVSVMRNEALKTNKNGGARNKSRNITSINNQMKGLMNAEKLFEDKLVSHSKRKNGYYSSKSKRHRIDSEDVIELKITWREARALMRPPAKIVPSINVVEGCEFEEFEDSAPVIGRPTIVGMDQLGEMFQWVQCEDCFKWRKVPSDALLSSRWICSENIWDHERSLCSAAEELTKEQLELLLSSNNKDSSEIENITEHHEDPFAAIEELNTSPNFAVRIDEEGPSSSLDQTRTKHKESCICVVCSSLKHRFRTLMERCGRKQGQQEVDETRLPKLQWENVGDLKTHHTIHNGNISPLNLNNGKGKKISASSLKGQIDLNIQPEEDEDSSPGSDSRLFWKKTSWGLDVIGNIIDK